MLGIQKSRTDRGIKQNISEKLDGVEESLIVKDLKSRNKVKRVIMKNKVIDKNIEEKMLISMSKSSDVKAGKTLKVNEDIVYSLDSTSIEKETTKENLADDIMSFYFKKLYNLKLSDKIDKIELGDIELVDIESNVEVNRVTQNIKMKKNIAKILKFTSVRESISQGEVFEKAAQYYFNKIYNRLLKDKIDKIESGEIDIVDMPVK